MKGFSWNTGSQIATSVSALIVVPIAIHRLGLSAYGVFTLAMTAVSLLQQLDGGMMNAAMRYLGLAAGKGDRQSAAAHLLTMLVIVAVIGTTLGLMVFFASPEVVRLFGIASPLRRSARFAMQVVGVMLPLGLIQGVLSAALQANGRYRVFASNNIVWRILYVVALVVLVHRRGGLTTLMWLVLLQQVAVVLTLLPPACRQVDMRKARLLPRSDVRQILRYSTRVQVFTLTGLVNLQLDTLIVGAALPLRDVALYGTGATIATQIRSLPMNAAAPMITRLAHSFGSGANVATFDEYVRLQSMWAVISSAFLAIVGGISLFLIEAWLGERFLTAGIVCLVLNVGNLVNLLTAPLTIYLQVIGRPEIEARYGLISAATNIVLTVSFLWLGVYGVAGATAVAQSLASAVLLWMARKRVSRDIPSFLEAVPWRAAGAAAILSGVAAAGITKLLAFHGVCALLIVGTATVPGTVGFLLCLFGPSQSIRIGREIGQRRSLAPLVTSLRHLTLT